MIAASAGAQGMTMPPGHGSATRPASGPSSQPASEYGRYASLVADLGLSDEQKAKVKEKAAALDAALKEPSGKIDAFHQEAFAAYKADDMKKAQKLFAAIAEQKKKIADITYKADYEVLALMTPEQKIKMHASGFRKMEAMTLLMIKIKFTGEQEKKFQDICEEYGKGVEELKDPADAKAKDALLVQADQKFKDLLTPEQKEQLAKWKEAATKPSPSHGHGGMGGMMGQ
jgi:Spy/CpxP family protein refolding chaperone